MTELHAESHEKDVEIDKWKSETEKLKAQLEELKKQAEPLNDEIVQKVKELEEKVSHLKNRQAEKEALEQKLKEATDDHSKKAIQERLQIIDRVIKSEAQVDELLEENEKLRQRLTELEKLATASSSPSSTDGGDSDKLGTKLETKSYARAAISYASGYATMVRKEKRQGELKALQTDIVNWINKVLETNFNEDQLSDELGSGVLLCDLLLKIDPGLEKQLGKIHREKAVAGNSFASENIHAFLRVCLDLGVPQHALFDVGDLDSEKFAVRKVVLGLMSMARVACQKYKVDPPGLIKLEMGIADEKTDSKEGDSEEAVALESKVKDFCKKEGSLAPTRVPKTFGTYHFNKNVTAPIRVLHDQLLVRHDNDWQTLKHFLKRYPVSRASVAPGLLATSDPDKLKAAELRIKELEAERANLLKQLEDKEDLQRQLDALKQKDEKHDSVATSPAPYKKNRSCWDWFRREKPEEEQVDRAYDATTTT